jgi:hypothetical protein
VLCGTTEVSITAPVPVADIQALAVKVLERL